MLKKLWWTSENKYNRGYSKPTRIKNVYNGQNKCMSIKDKITRDTRNFFEQEVEGK